MWGVGAAAGRGEAPALLASLLRSLRAPWSSAAANSRASRSDASSSASMKAALPRGWVVAVAAVEAAMRRREGRRVSVGLGSLKAAHPTHPLWDRWRRPECAALRRLHLAPTPKRNCRPNVHFQLSSTIIRGEISVGFDGNFQSHAAQHLVPAPTHQPPTHNVNVPHSKPYTLHTHIHTSPSSSPPFPRITL